jgi:hypothetical protein
MKEDNSTLPKIRRRVQRMLIVDRTIRFFFMAWILYKILMKFNFLGFSDLFEGSHYANDTIFERFVEMSE